MKFSIIITSTLLSAVSALPGVPAMITDAPEPRGIPAATSKPCTSTQCFASYVPCHGSLTFINSYYSLFPATAVCSTSGHNSLLIVLDVLRPALRSRLPFHSDVRLTSSLRFPSLRRLRRLRNPYQSLPLHLLLKAPCRVEDNTGVCLPSSSKGYAEALCFSEPRGKLRPCGGIVDQAIRRISQYPLFFGAKYEISYPLAREFQGQSVSGW
ncbi:hypothetical protein GGR50DRAFT_638748 [Xylaria sp. CBS 124048]|nr:hypothetical protein GGR50DRAFT_638748 [Xylaria sp. CBS 124048]